MSEAASTELPNRLISAYRATDYVVFADLEMRPQTWVESFNRTRLFGRAPVPPGLGRTKVNELMGVEFDTIKVGTRRLIDMKSANAWLGRRLESERQRSASQREAV